MASPAAAPVTLDSSSNVGGLRLVQRGTYDPASGAVSGVGPYAAIWIAGGKIWRASATAGGTPSAAQVSSEANVGDPSPLNPTPFHLCDTAVVNDWANPGESRFFYTLAGSDKQCGGSDDVEKSTRLAAPASEAPVTVPGKRVAAIQTPATGALSGWLVLGTSFVRTDASFASPVVVLAGVGAAALVARTPSQMLMRVHSSSTVRVHRFDPSAGTLDSTALFTLPGGISASTGATAQDATNAYMIAYDASFAPSLYRLALSATQADSAVQVTSEAGRTVTSLLFQTTNKVSFTVSTSGTASLVAVDKTAAGSAAAPALGAAFPSGTSLTPIAALGDKVYFNSAAPSGVRTARAFDEAGTSAIAQADAEWLGFTDVGTTSTAVLATGLSATGKYGGATVSTLVVATGASGITLGTLPAEIDTVERARWSGSKGLLRSFTLATGGATYGEILFADAGTAGSLVRVTNTSSVSEFLP